MAGIDQAAVDALALALSQAHGGNSATTEETNVAQAIGDMILKAVVNPTLLIDAEARPITGTGTLS